MIDQQIFKTRQMEVTNVIHYPNTSDYRLLIPNMIRVAMQSLKMLRGEQTKVSGLAL
jgi:hypothetical protein